MLDTYWVKESSIPHLLRGLVENLIRLSKTLGAFGMSMLEKLVMRMIYRQLIKKPIMIIEAILKK